MFLYHPQLVEEDDGNEDGADEPHHEEIDGKETTIDRAAIGELAVDHCSARSPSDIKTREQGSDGHHVLCGDAVEEVHERHSEQLQVISPTRETAEHSYHARPNSHYPCCLSARPIELLVEISRTYLMH